MVGTGYAGNAYNGATTWLLPNIPATQVQTTLVGAISLLGAEGTGVSADGGVMVGQTYDTDGSHVGYRWTSATGFVRLPQTRGGGNGFACSGDGSVIVGSFYPTPSSGQFYPARWVASTGQVESLGVPGNRGESVAISDDARTIAGYSRTTSNRQDPFVWRTSAAEVAGIATLLPIPTGTAPTGNVYDISADGLCVVGYSSGTGGINSLSVRPSIWRQATESSPWTLQQLPLLPGMAYGFAHATNLDGSIVVGNESTTNGQPGVGFVWTQALGMMTTAQFVQSVGLGNSGWQIDGFTDISSDGRTLIGAGTNPQGVYSALAIQIPAPLSAAVLAIASASLGIRRPRRSDPYP